MKIEINGTITIKALKLFLYSAYKNQSWGGNTGVARSTRRIKGESF